MAGDDVALRLAWASTQVPPTVLRVVDPAQDIPRLREELAAEGIKTRPGKFSARALVVESGNVQASHALMEGRVVIQDEASQLVADLLEPQAGHRVLDLCAAPGIKAGQIAQALGSGHSRGLRPERLAASHDGKAASAMASERSAVADGSTGCDQSSSLCAASLSEFFWTRLVPARERWRATRRSNGGFDQADLSRLAEAQVKMLKGALGFSVLGGAAGLCHMLTGAGGK